MSLTLQRPPIESTIEPDEAPKRRSESEVGKAEGQARPLRRTRAGRIRRTRSSSAASRASISSPRRCGHSARPSAHPARARIRHPRCRRGRRLAASAVRPRWRSNSQAGSRRRPGGDRIAPRPAAAVRARAARFRTRSRLPQAAQQVGASTEIDWKAYLNEGPGDAPGERDHRHGHRGLRVPARSVRTVDRAAPGRAGRDHQLRRDEPDASRRFQRG